MTQFEWVPTPEGWFSSSCPDWAINEAKERHAGNQELFGETDNYMDQASSQNGEDTRWSGQLGEIALANFLTIREIPHHWDAQRDRLAPDFGVRDHAWDLKTKTVGGYPKMSDTYFATVPDKQWTRVKQGKSDIVAYMFANYNYKLNHLFILGAMSIQAFAKMARYRVPGEVVHPFYTVKVHSWDVLLSELVVPTEWR